MDTLNSPSTEQEPGGNDPGDSPVGGKDGAGDHADGRINDLMGLANRRLTQAEKAKQERDEARAEIDALRAQLDAMSSPDWAEPRDEPEPGVDAERADVVDGDVVPDEVADEEDELPEGTILMAAPPWANDPRTHIDVNSAPRTALRHTGMPESDISVTRRRFEEAARIENERLFGEVWNRS
jgi:hypothetical protein